MTGGTAARAVAAAALLAAGALAASWLWPSSSTVVIRVPGDAATIQAAIDLAPDGGTVLIADGVYSGIGNYDIDPAGKRITIRSTGGPDKCIIDCQRKGRGFVLQSGETLATVISGLTIRNGYWVGTGGGIACISASPTIEQCHIEQCTAYYLGGGILCSASRAVIRNCAFRNNLAGTWGGGISCVGGGAARIESCGLTGNFAVGRGGGFYSEDTGLRVVNCTVSGNYARQGGGAYLFISHGAELSNCLFARNNGRRRGGGVSLDRTSAAISNCTFWLNEAGERGGAVNCERSSPLLLNCILWDNTAAAGPELAVGGYDALSQMIVRHSNIRGGAAAAIVEPLSVLRWAEGMMSEDPLFIEDPDGRLCLSQRRAGQQHDSPCVDRGSKPATGICFSVNGGSTCLDQFSTRVDGGPDQGQADMGVHWRRK